MNQSVPKALRYARIFAGIAVIRLIGLVLFTAPSTSIPSYYSTTFGLGDVLTGVFALPVAWALGRGGIRTYALATTWAFVGFIDLVYAVTIATQAGLFNAISNFFGTGIIILPIAMIIQLIVLGLLLTGPVSKYMARPMSP